MLHGDFRWGGKKRSSAHVSSKEKGRLKWCQGRFTLSQGGQKEV